MTDDAVTRRSAITAAGFVVVGGIAGYFAARHTSSAKYRAAGQSSNGYYYVTKKAPRALVKLADIPDGGGVILPPVVITRSGSTVHAFSSTCTHQGCTVSRVADGTIDCPCHGSKFDATTGKVRAGPAFSPLPPRPVYVRNGEVFSV